MAHTPFAVLARIRCVGSGESGFFGMAHLLFRVGPSGPPVGATASANPVRLAGRHPPSRCLILVNTHQLVMSHVPAGWHSSIHPAPLCQPQNRAIESDLLPSPQGVRVRK